MSNTDNVSSSWRLKRNIQHMTNLCCKTQEANRHSGSVIWDLPLQWSRERVVLWSLLTIWWTLICSNYTGKDIWYEFYNCTFLGDVFRLIDFVSVGTFSCRFNLCLYSVPHKLCTGCVSSFFCLTRSVFGGYNHQWKIQWVVLVYKMVAKTFRPGMHVSNISFWQWASLRLIHLFNVI